MYLCRSPLGKKNTTQTHAQMKWSAISVGLERKNGGISGMLSIGNNKWQKRNKNAGNQIGIYTMP